jgi:DNA repair ATPase RecN
MRMFYTLPEPNEAGLKWKEYERAAEKVRRIEERLQETQNERARLEQEVRDLGDAEIAELKAAILRGEDDPLARHDEHAKLVERLRALKREEAAVSQALPQAEEELRLTIYEHQHRWKDEADSALEKAIAEERKAYEKVRRLIEEPRTKRLYAESLAAWVRNVSPAFGTPDDVAGRSAIQNLESSVYAAEERMRERLEAERFTQQQEGVA